MASPHSPPPLLSVLSLLSVGKDILSPVSSITRVIQGSILLHSAAQHYREDGQPHFMSCAVFVPRCNPSRVFLQLASQIAEGSSPVWFCTVFSLLWVSLSALQPPVKRLEAFPSLLASFWYSNLHLPLFPSCAVFLHSEFPWYSFSKEQTSCLSLGRNGNLLV